MQINIDTSKKWHQQIYDPKKYLKLSAIHFFHTFFSPFFQLEGKTIIK
jgi:hypothetical protein